jgi:hypothetical protein
VSTVTLGLTANLRYVCSNHAVTLWAGDERQLRTAGATSERRPSGTLLFVDAKRRAGLAIILESSRELERDGDAWLLPDLGLNRYGRRRYEFALDIRVPGIEP